MIVWGCLLFVHYSTAAAVCDTIAAFSFALNNLINNYRAYYIFLGNFIDENISPSTDLQNSGVQPSRNSLTDLFHIWLNSKLEACSIDFFFGLLLYFCQRIDHCKRIYSWNFFGNKNRLHVFLNI